MGGRISGESSSNPLLEVRLPTVCEIGQAHLLVKDLMQLRPGMVIPLQSTKGLISLLTGGQRIALAKTTKKLRSGKKRLRIYRVLWRESFRINL